MANYNITEFPITATPISDTVSQTTIDSILGLKAGLLSKISVPNLKSQIVVPESADDISYDNTISELIATNVQSAIDEIIEKLGLDYIIEEGTSDIWTYRKWKNGTSECWGTRQVNTPISTEWGNLYDSGNLGYIDYPAGLFTQSPVITGCPNGTNAAWVIIYSQGTAVHTPNMMLVRATSVSSTYENIRLYAVGKWV